MSAHQPVRSVLGKLQGTVPMTDAELRAASAAAWHKSGFICLRADWLQGWGDKELAAAIATKVHGKRKIGGK